MELDKFKKWLDLAGQNQSESFWNQIFDEKVQNNEKQTIPNPFTVAQEFIPKCDLYEVDNILVLEIEIPGLKKEDLRITINHQNVMIIGEFKSFHSKNKYYLKERANRTFKKELSLPFPILIQSIRSEISSGILIIKMPINREEIENIPITFDH
ncbi:MAG: Hsp20/alpha crystallin family protein [Bacillota bacterium]|nr:Hsp20/alpha crystallin family protein [Bacillota bacterium]